MAGYEKIEKHRLWDTGDDHYLEWQAEGDDLWVIDSGPLADHDGTLAGFSISSLIEALVESGRITP